MHNLILFDDETRTALLPLTFTRPVSELRVGALTIREKWEHDLGGKGSFITNEYLAPKFPIDIREDNFVINGSVLPNPKLVRLVSELDRNEALMSDGDLIAARIPGNEFDSLIDGSFAEEISGYGLRETPATKVMRCWDIFRLCGEEILLDFDRLTSGRNSQPLPSTCQVLGDGPVFLGEGAVIHQAIINTYHGPVYIGENSEIMEGALIRGPVSIGANSVVKMGAKIYGNTAIGPYCKVGGELNNVVFQGYSNKAHDGFLGNSVIGEWCNLGADTNCSNLKNTYSHVKAWNYAVNDFEDTGLQFCGLVFGDHSKCGINTMFNTGSVVGVSANVFGPGFPAKYIPSFTWGMPGNGEIHELDKAIATARSMMSRRDVELTDIDEALLQAIYRQALDQF